MSLLRFAGRCLFSSFFVADGYKSFTQPDKYVLEVAPTVNAVVPRVKAVLPESLSDKVPDDTKAWVRLLGVAQVAGGVGYATGLMRRPGAMLLVLTSVPHVVAALPTTSDDPESKRHSHGNLLRNLSLLGAAIIATQDTEGKPSLWWRLRYGHQQVTAAADRSKDAKDTIAKSTEAPKKLTAARDDVATAKVAKNVQHSADQAQLAANKGCRKTHAHVKGALN